MFQAQRAPEDSVTDTAPKASTELQTTESDAQRTVGDVDIAMLYRMNKGQMLAVARRIVGTDVDAEDVVQQAFLNGLKHAASFQGRAQPSSWMYRITTNTALMHLRTRRRKGASSLDALPQEVAELHVERASGKDIPLPDEEVVWAGVNAEVRAAVAELPVTDRQIVEMRLCDGFSTEEVASETGLTTGAIKSRLFRARRALQERLMAGDVAASVAM
jgi:RNA polymerase sigma-70 factor (ECF subfamily)